MAQTGAERTELHRLKKEASELSTDYLNGAAQPFVPAAAAAVGQGLGQP